MLFCLYKYIPIIKGVYTIYDLLYTVYDLLPYYILYNPIINPIINPIGVYKYITVYWLSISRVVSGWSVTRVFTSLSPII